MLNADERKEYLEELSNLIDFLKDNPEVPLNSSSFQEFTIFLYKEDSYSVREIAQHLKVFEKNTSGEMYFWLKRKFGKTVSLRYIWPREDVCTSIVTGTKTVTKQVPLGGYRTETVEEDIIEWHCPKTSLLKKENA